MKRSHHHTKSGVHVTDKRVSPHARRVVAVLACGALVLLPSAGTAIAKGKAECTPSDATTIPAQGEPRIEVPNPEYVPGVPETGEWVETAPAVYKTAYQRYSWTGGPTDVAPTEIPPSANWTENTTNYDGAGHGTEPLNVAFPRNDNGKGDWFYWTATDVEVTPAQYEWRIITPEVPAQGDPTMWVPNPAYVEEQTIPAVVCTDVTDPKPAGPSDVQPKDEQKDEQKAEQKAEQKPEQKPAAPAGESNRAAEPTRPVVKVTG